MDQTEQRSKAGIFAFLLFLCLTVLSSCGKSKEIRLSQADQGRSVEAKTGQTVIIKLKSNPSTGYSWGVDKLDRKVLRPSGDPTFKADSKMVGSSGEETFHFQVIGKGRSELQMVYRRPWEKGIKPIKSFSVKVIVE